MTVPFCVESVIMKENKKQNRLIFLCSGKHREYDYVCVKNGEQREWESKGYISTFIWVGDMKVNKVTAERIRNQTIAPKREYILHEKCIEKFCEALLLKGYVNANSLLQSFEHKKVIFLFCEEFTQDEVKEKISILIQQYHSVTTTKKRVGVNLPEEIIGENKIDWVETKGTWVVYQHISPSGKSYIGITQQEPEKRWQNGNGYTSQRKFYNAIKKYGWESFQHNILKENICEEAASYWEKYFIKLFDSYYNGYNATEGGLHEK